MSTATEAPAVPASTSGSAAPGPAASRRWWILIVVVAVVALGVRLTYLFVWMHPLVAQGDPYYYHHAANLFADGRGWPDPYALFLRNRYVNDAQHPPLTSALLAVPSVLGLTSFLSHQIFTCLLGVAAVVVVGLTGRKVGGDATGLIAAVIAAVYPGMWLNDALVMSETTGILACSLTMLAAYRFWERRRLVDAAWLGAGLAAAMLARAELGLLALTLVVPLILLVRDAAWRRRLVLLATSGVSATVLVAPWCLYNLSRFEEPEFISTGLGSTLAVTHCPATYSGEHTGWWSYECILNIPGSPDERSERDVYYRKKAYEFIGDNASSIPRVAAARLGRTWGVYKPWQQVELDALELRPTSLGKAGLVSLWLLEAAAVAGTVVLRRRRVVLVPLLAVPVALSAASVMIYGTTRFRAAAEPAVVLLAAVAFTALGTEVVRRRRADRPRPVNVDSTDPGADPPPSSLAASSRA